MPSGAVCASSGRAVKKSKSKIIIRMCRALVMRSPLSSCGDRTPPFYLNSPVRGGEACEAHRARCLALVLTYAIIRGKISQGKYFGSGGKHVAESLPRDSVFCICGGACRPNESTDQCGRDQDAEGRSAARRDQEEY